MELPQEKQRELSTICREFDVQRLTLFGSGTRLPLPEAHDLDFVVTFASSETVGAFDRYMEFKAALEKFYGKPVDLLSAKSLRNPVLKATISAEAQIVYAA